jgi:hypothetical protein
MSSDGCPAGHSSVNDTNDARLKMAPTCVCDCVLSVRVSCNRSPVSGHRTSSHHHRRDVDAAVIFVEKLGEER